MILCSRCGELIKDGWDYRWHFDKHLEEFDTTEDKTEYIKQTTQIVNDKIIDNMSKMSNKNRYTQLMEWLPTLSSKRKKRVKPNDTRQPLQPRRIKNG
jgi:uncharacterized C2H2 Zn-finger protein